MTQTRRSPEEVRNKNEPPWLRSRRQSAQICDDVTADDYYGNYNQYMTSHRLARFRKSPFKFHLNEKGLLADRKADMTHHQAIHCLVLEGEAEFEKQFYVDDGPINPKTGKPYGRDTKKFKDFTENEIPPGTTWITQDESNEAFDMLNAIMDHSEAWSLLGPGGIPELTIRGHWRGSAFQSRLDYVRHNPGESRSGGVIVDLKTTKDLGHNHTDEFPCSFVRDCKAYGYFDQMAFYRRALKMATGRNYAVAIVAVELEYPHQVGVFKIASDKLDFHDERNDLEMERYERCVKEGFWPTGFERAITLS